MDARALGQVRLGRNRFPGFSLACWEWAFAEVSHREFTFPALWIA